MFDRVAHAKDGGDGVGWDQGLDMVSQQTKMALKADLPIPTTSSPSCTSRVAPQQPNHPFISPPYPTHPFSSLVLPLPSILNHPPTRSSCFGYAVDFTA